MQFMKKYLILMSFLFVSLFASAQVEMILGEWRTVDDVTGVTKGIVEFYRGDDGLYYGKIVKVFWKGEELKNTGAEGLVVIKEMEEHDGMLRNGFIFEPESKKTYYGKVYYNKEDNTITLRGSLDRKGWIGRSQTWIR